MLLLMRAQVLKQWLRELPCPVIPSGLHGQCTVYAGKQPAEVTAATQACMFAFAAAHDVLLLQVLQWLMTDLPHMHAVFLLYM